MWWRSMARFEIKLRIKGEVDHVKKVELIDVLSATDPGHANHAGRVYRG